MLALLLLLGCLDSTPTDSGTAPLTPPPVTADGEHVAITTPQGVMVVGLYRTEAPISTDNFLAYVTAGFYDGSDGDGATVIHRVEPGFVIQGGGERADGSAKATFPPIVNEASTSGLSNVRGTLAMARTSDPNSATSQWFVNLVNNPGLDANPDDGSPGYAVFGIVVSGLEVVDDIAGVPTSGSRPIEPIPILDATMTDPPGTSGSP